MPRQSGGAVPDAPGDLHRKLKALVAEFVRRADSRREASRERHAAGDIPGHCYATVAASIWTDAASAVNELLKTTE